MNKIAKSRRPLAAGEPVHLTIQKEALLYVPPRKIQWECKTSAHIVYLLMTAQVHAQIPLDNNAPFSTFAWPQLQPICLLGTTKSIARTYGGK